ncbi:MAG: hypothetical protein IJW10_01050 [Clostridia bacterium]|nr:hypothetical protein [Clostridia bacterium]
MKKLFLVLIVVIISCAFVVSVSAENATDANPLGGYDADPGVDPITHRVTADESIDLSSYFTRTANKNNVITNDTTSKSVLYDSVTGKYYVFKSIYLTQDMTKFEYYVSDLNTAIASYANANSIDTYPQFSMYSSLGNRAINELVHYQMPEGVTKLDGSHCLLKNNKLMKSAWVASSITSIATHIFSGNRNLEYVYNFENIKISDGTTFNNLFENSPRMKEIKFPNIQNATFGNLGQMWGSQDGVSDTTVAANRQFRIYIPNSTYSFGTSFWNVNGNLGSFEIVYCGTDYEAFLENNSSALGSATVVKSSEYKLGDFTNKYNFVCDYNFCVAYKAGVHDYKGTGDCKDGVKCDRCDDTIAGKASHTEYETLVYVSFASNGVYNYGCSNEGCTKYDIVDKTMEPLFTAKGYSVGPDGYSLKAGFTVNTDALVKYKELHPDFTFGMIMVNAGSVSADASLFVNGSINTTAKGLQISIDNIKYTSWNADVAGFNASVADSLELVVGIYTNDGEGNVSVIQYIDADKYATTKTYADMSLNAITFNQVRVGHDMDALVPQPAPAPTGDEQ